MPIEVSSTLTGIKISIVICTYNRYDLLPGAIASVELQNYPSDQFELLIVDNSDDLESQASFRDELTITCNHQYIVEKTKGLSRARNIGGAVARGDVVAFIDDDARIPPDWASHIVATFDDHPKAGMVGGPVRPIWPAARPIWLHPWLESFLTIIDRGQDLRELRPEEWLAGTNIAFRSDLLRQAGVFHEQIGRIGKLLLSNEELAIADKIRELGYSSVYNPDAYVEHHVHQERIEQAWMRRRVFWQAISDIFVTGGSPSCSFEDDVDRVLKYFASRPPKNRSLPGLFQDVDDADLFHTQTEAISALVRVMATDGRDWRTFLRVDPRS